MLHWAEENKIRTKRNGNYEIPQRNGIDWKFDFKFVTKLDRMLTDGLDVKLKKVLSGQMALHLLLTMRFSHTNTAQILTQVVHSSIILMTLSQSKLSII